jgi:hypothetical protein
VGKTDEALGGHVREDNYKNDELDVLHEGLVTTNEPGRCIARGENHDIFASKAPIHDENGDIVLAVKATGIYILFR